MKGVFVGLYYIIDHTIGFMSLIFNISSNMHGYVKCKISIVCLASIDDYTLRICSNAKCTCNKLLIL